MLKFVAVLRMYPGGHWADCLEISLSGITLVFLCASDFDFQLCRSKNLYLLVHQEQSRLLQEELTLNKLTIH